MDALKNYFISLIRTAVPFIVSGIVGLLATRNITLDSESLRLLVLLVEGIGGLAYWQVVRMLEHVDHRFGWLLGYAKMPTYIVLPDGKVPGVGAPSNFAGLGPVQPPSAGLATTPPAIPTMTVPQGTGEPSK